VAVLIRTLLRIAIALCVLPLGLTPALAIFGGDTVPGRDPLAKALVAILYQTETGAHLCTGAVLAPRLVLTAAHCTDGDRRSIKIIFSTDLTDVASDQLRAASAVARAPQTPAAEGRYAYNNPDDVALILLDSPAPSGTRFATLADTAPSGKVLAAGYGATSDFRKPNALGQHQLGFDRILRRTDIPLLATDDALLTADQTKGTGACTGDSGGPALLANGRSLVGVLIGVSSARDNNDYCRGKVYFAAIPRWKPWIATAAAAFSQTLN
jgi:secreted trypsin-like serine protease